MNLEEALEILEQEIGKEKRDQIARVLRKAIVTGNKKREKRINLAVEKLRTKEAENTSEAVKIMEAIINSANAIFEIAAPEMTGDQVPPSPNKIKKTAKNKGDLSKKVEKVSVEDELFPYEGSAKEQMNQKILAKINDMIEGKATLADLVQLVKMGNKKPVVQESTTPAYDKAMSLLEVHLYNVVDHEANKLAGKAVNKIGGAVQKGADALLVGHHKKKIEGISNAINQEHANLINHAENGNMAGVIASKRNIKNMTGKLHHHMDHYQNGTNKPYTA